MLRTTAEKAAELAAFWCAHLEAWQASDLNQREYCERHGLPLKRFGNWRAKLRDEAPFRPAKLLWRRDPVFGGRIPLQSVTKSSIHPAKSYSFSYQ